MTLSVLTLNLWNDRGAWPRRAARVRAWIERLGPDLIGFQEALRGEGGDQVAGLLAGLPYHLDYVAASPFFREGSAFGRATLGNAIASRWPLHGREELRLPDAGDGETRAALSLRVAAPFGEVGFTCTHLHWRFRAGAVRERQVVAVCDLVLRRRPCSGFPPLLVGDFNAEPDSAEIRFLTGLQSLGGRSAALLDAWRVAGGGGPGFTWSNRNPNAAAVLEPDRRIDYVFAGFPIRSGIGRITACRVVCDDAVDGVWPSDHFGVYAELATRPLPGLEREWGLAGGDDVGARV